MSSNAMRSRISPPGKVHRATPNDPPAKPSSVAPFGRPSAAGQVILTPLILPGRTGNRVETLVSRDLEQRDVAGLGVEQAGLMRMIVGKQVAAERLIARMRRMSKMGKAFRLGPSRPAAQEYGGDEETDHGPESQMRERFSDETSCFLPRVGNSLAQGNCSDVSPPFGRPLSRHDPRFKTSRPGTMRGKSGQIRPGGHLESRGHLRSEPQLAQTGFRFRCPNGTIWDVPGDGPGRF